MAWPNHVHTQKRSPSLPANQGSGAIKDAGAATSSDQRCLAGGPRRRDEQPPLLVESDLSGEMAVGDDELDAIIRLLGDALDDILSDTGDE